ncbi:hypothetical protein [Acidimangrovimonas sediminis]|uniref:hypothetical protein n=1 Tax=Acidimangrovimonas sediminis TaxID=2056283 RepID=UPI0011AF69D7|nr:hypothetical protein [Acidimangrovimonas sediminis]
MKGYQYAHVETYAVKPANPNGPGGGQKRRNGDRKWSASDVMKEAEREALASQHVAEGGPPPELLAGDVDSFAELREAHSKAASKTESYVRTQRDGTKKKIRRKLRSDAPTLYTCVVSLPVLTVDALREPELREDCHRIIRAAMDHERARIEAAGGKMMLGVIHWDEEHVHAHFYAIDPERGRVNHLHPGHAAKEAEVARLRDKGSKQEINRAGNRAYCDAMRRWQDDFHRNVFDEAGLLRLGPKARRLTRAEYNRQKEAKAQEAKDRKRQKELAATNAELDAKNAALAQSLAAELERRERLDQREAGLKVKEGDIIERWHKAKVDKQVATTAKVEAVRAKAEAEAYKNAVEIGSDAVLTRQIEYREATEDRREGLGFGPNRPATKAARETLKAAVQPAYDYILGFARRVAGVWKQEDRQKRKEAEHRRQARVLRAAEERAGRKPDPVLGDIAEGRDPDYGPEDFPGAWAVEVGTPVEKVLARLRGIPNLGLRACHRATTDAVLICEDRPDLRGDFERGIFVLEDAAKRRGFDIDTGRHDPSKATDPAEASRYTDQLPDQIAITRRNGARERTRR